MRLLLLFLCFVLGACQGGVSGGSDHDDTIVGDDDDGSGDPQNGNDDDNDDDEVPPGLLLAADATDEKTPLVFNWQLLAETADTVLESLAISSGLGSVTDAENGTFVYDPEAAYISLAEGSQATVVVDGRGGGKDFRITITVAGINDPPTAANVAAETNSVEPIAVDVLLAATDPDAGDVLSLQSVSTPTVDGVEAGSATIDENGHLYFVPDPTVDGMYLIAFTVADSREATDTATLSVNVRLGEQVEISDFSINPNPVFPGDLLVVSWSVSGGVELCTLYRNDEEIYSSDATGEHSHEEYPESSATFHLQCTGDGADRDEIHQAIFQKAYFVDRNKSSGDGSSWDSPFTTIQEAVDAAVLHFAPIWVKEGNYAPSSLSAPVVHMAAGIHLFGSFSSDLEGDEGDVSTRDFSEHPTVIVGNTKTRGIVGASDIVIDGVVIVDGAADGAAPCGGGMLLEDASNVYLENMKFAANRTVPVAGGGDDALGGALCVKNSTNVVLVNVGFVENAATGATNVAPSSSGGNGYGGAVYVEASSITLTNCWFDGNEAIGANGTTGTAGSTGTAGGHASGGAIYLNQTSSLTMDAGNEFHQNGAYGGRGGSGGSPFMPGGAYGNGGPGGAAMGGAIYLEDYAALNISAVLISNNEAVGGQGGLSGGNACQTSCGDGSPGVDGVEGEGAGGGIFHLTFDTPATLTSVTITANHASTHGGGIYNEGAALVIVTSTVTGNTPDQIYSN